MQYDSITTDGELAELCDRLRGAAAIGFDTEFVSEHSYRPELCLIQIAAPGTLAVIDPQKIEDVRPFWQLLSEPDHQTIVHAGREEFLFCRHAIQQRPHRLFDVQIAAGLIGLEYPAAYGTLIARLLDKKVAKGETRTDWRRRPLTQRQLEYALLDVIHLQELRDLLCARLEKLGRLAWFETEIETWQQELEEYDDRENWFRVSGTSGLSPRGHATVRELWRWREAEAARRNSPVKRILRDDLIVELARRGTADVKRIKLIRGLERGDLQRHIPALSAAIEKALNLDDDQLPRLERRPPPRQLNVLAQFLTTALNNICRAEGIAPSIVGTVQDLRELLAFRLQVPGVDPEPPALARGWRAELVGDRIQELLEGKQAIRIEDPMSEQPLRFVPYP